MQTVSRREYLRRRRYAGPPPTHEKMPLVQLPLDMYEERPTLTFELGRLEDVAVERCLLLRIIENASLRGLQVDSDEWRSFIVQEVKSHQLTTYYGFFGLADGKSELEAKENDHVAHYMLRLAYCNSVDAQKRFCQLEKRLFSLKFSYLQQEYKEAVIKVYSSEYKSREYLDIFIHDDVSVVQSLLESTAVFDTDYYLVPFFKACKSVSQRAVFMQQGTVYLPAERMWECLEYDFGVCLQKGLIETQQNCLENVENDERVKTILYFLDKSTTAKQKTFKSAEFDLPLRLQDVDMYAQNHYPLCMYTLHKALTTNQHLKHYARLQYGLFLKDVGFECDDVHAIYRQHFCKKIDENQFTKKYSYSIKYMYGLSGRKQIQNSYNCARILERGVSCGAEHGCPFKHWGQVKLREVLAEKGLPCQDIEDIVQLKEDGWYQKACTKCFDSTHRENYAKIVEHPNEYFLESRQRLDFLEILKERTRELDESEDEEEEED